MNALFYLIVGLVPAAVVRFLIHRKRLEPIPSVLVCLAILLTAAIIATGRVQKRASEDDEQSLGGPIPILADLASQTVTFILPVTALSYFILRIKDRESLTSGNK